MQTPHNADAPHHPAATTPKMTYPWPTYFIGIVTALCSPYHPATIVPTSAIPTPTVPAPIIPTRAVPATIVRSKSFCSPRSWSRSSWSGGHWTRGGRGTTPRNTPSRQPSVSHSNVHLPDGDVACAQSALRSFFDLDGAPSINMADGLRADYGSPLGR
jgi:hypothetical protein